jgi:imidazolonepropionase-like amidohydrolase
MAQDKGIFKLLRAGRLIDGLGGPPRERVALLIEGSRIHAVGPEESVAPPQGASATEYDFSDHTILPGLVDCHTHINAFGDGSPGDDLALLPDDTLLLQSVKNARIALRAGVTTMRENGAKGRTALALREAIGMGIAQGPRLVLCGRALTITGGHLCFFGSEAVSPVQI